MLNLRDEKARLGSVWNNEVSLSKEDRAKIEGRLEALEERIPAFSNVSLKFDYRGIKVLGKMRIRTPLRTFEAEAYGLGVFETFCRLESKIDQQIMNWKKERFFKTYMGNEGVHPEAV